MSRLEYNPRTREWEKVGAPAVQRRIEDPDCETIMPFGKHQGLKINEIDSGYLSWLLHETDIEGDLREAVSAELKQR